MKHDEATLALPGATHRVPHSRSVAGIGFDAASAFHTRRSRQLFGAVDPRTLALYVIVLNVLLMGAGSTALVMTSLGVVWVFLVLTCLLYTSPSPRD